MRLQFTRSSRRHKIGRAHAEHVIGSVIGIQGGPNDRGETTVEWIGLDNRGVELEIGAVVVDGGETLLILHVMPTALRRK